MEADICFLWKQIYGENILKLVLNGNHMKGGVEGHTTMYLALSRKYFANWNSDNSQVWKILKMLANLTCLSFENTADRKTLTT